MILDGRGSYDFPQDAVIARDLLCGGCGYNLRTLVAAGVCPECGEPVEQSVLVLSRPDLAARAVRLASVIPIISLFQAFLGPIQIVASGMLLVAAHRLRRVRDLDHISGMRRKLRHLWIASLVSTIVAVATAAGAASAGLVQGPWWGLVASFERVLQHEATTFPARAITIAFGHDHLAEIDFSVKGDGSVVVKSTDRRGRPMGRKTQLAPGSSVAMVDGNGTPVTVSRDSLGNVTLASPVLPKPWSWVPASTSRWAPAALKGVVEVTVGPGDAISAQMIDNTPREIRSEKLEPGGRVALPDAVGNLVTVTLDHAGMVTVDSPAAKAARMDAWKRIWPWAPLAVVFAGAQFVAALLYLQVCRTLARRAGRRVLTKAFKVLIELLVAVAAWLAIACCAMVGGVAVLATGAGGTSMDIVAMPVGVCFLIAILLSATGVVWHFVCSLRLRGALRQAFRHWRDIAASPDQVHSNGRSAP